MKKERVAIDVKVDVLRSLNNLEIDSLKPGRALILPFVKNEGAESK